MLKKGSTGFSMECDEKGLVRISDSALRLIIPPQLQTIAQFRKIMCGCEIFIQAETY